MKTYEARWIDAEADQTDPANWTWFTVGATFKIEAIRLAEMMVEMVTDRPTVLIVSETVHCAGKVPQPMNWLGNVELVRQVPEFRSVRRADTQQSIATAM